MGGGVGHGKQNRPNRSERRRRERSKSKLPTNVTVLQPRSQERGDEIAAHGESITRVDIPRPEAKPNSPSWAYKLRDNISARRYTDDDRRTWLRMATGYVPNYRHKFTFRVRHALHSAYYSYVQPAFQSRGLGVLTNVKWALSIVHLFGPLWVVVYAAVTKIHDWQHILGFAAIYIGLLFLVETLIRKKERDFERERARANRVACAAAWEKTHRVLKQIVTFKESPDLESQKNHAKEELAEWMVHTLAQRTGESFEQLEIGIFVYSDPSCNELRACARVPVTNQREQHVVLPGCLLHWVARTGVDITVPCTHYSWHPFDMTHEFIETSKSKLLVPLTEPDEDDKMCCFGVISVESPRPFHFYPGLTNEIKDAIRPLTKLVRLISGNAPYKRRAEQL